MEELSIGPIILDVAGLTLTTEDKEILLHPQVGGVIFFSRNYESPEQLKDLAQNIKHIRPQCLLCVDQEGGRVQRFVNGLTKLPKIRLLGELIDSDRYSLEQVLAMSENLGYLMALEVRSLGVDLSFAPVLDLDKGISEVIRDRGFHRDPQIVALLATAYIQGMAKAGMRATGKHFPGHGSVTIDSHVGLPEDTRTFAQISEDLAPFRDLISKGIDAIMPAHIVYPNIDPSPVGFSHYWLQTVLRQQCGFQGTIVSDDLSMGGATGMGSYAERAQRALDAGCDYLLVCNNRLGAIEALEGIKPKKDSASYARRLSLFAKNDIPAWPALWQASIWQKSYATLEPLLKYPLLA